MKKSIIICEGNTDLVCIQYFLETVHGWEYNKKLNHKLSKINSMKQFSNNGNILLIAESGGCSKIKEVFDEILDFNFNLTKPDDAFDKIVIVSDRDDNNSEEILFNDIKLKTDKYKTTSFQLANNQWTFLSYTNNIGDYVALHILPLIIPLDGKGAIETFLLNALMTKSKEDDPEKIDYHVINQCNGFIDNINCYNKYLTNRRDKIKAKFNTVFSVMTPAEAFNRRRDILKSIQWEKYELIQEGFKELKKLHKG